MEKRLANLEALEKEAAHFVGSLAPGTQATLVTLSGELGAGKTAFTKAAAKALGVEDTVTSPTFVLEKIYTLPAEKKFKHLVHIDAYRLEGDAELAPLGFDELARDPENLVFFEWPERTPAVLAQATHKISLRALEDGSRDILYA